MIGGVDEELPESFRLLHLVSYFGILPLIEKLVLTKNWLKKIKLLYYLNTHDGKGMTALMWAARSGEEAVARLLLEKGANTVVLKSKGMVKH